MDLGEEAASRGHRIDSYCMGGPRAMQALVRVLLLLSTPRFPIIYGGRRQN